MRIASAVLVSLGILAAPDVSLADTPSTAHTTAAREIDWDTLLPVKERENHNPAPPPPIHDYLGEGNIAALQSGSYATNPELNGQRIRLPGFVVPLERDDKGLVTVFFLVPYFGACIHVPPPPPNQMVYVKMRTGMGLTSLEDAQWVTGTLHASTRSSPLGAASYTLDGDKAERYEFTRP